MAAGRAERPPALLSVSVPLSTTVKKILRQLGSGEAINLNNHQPKFSPLLETTDIISLVAAQTPRGLSDKKPLLQNIKPKFLSSFKQPEGQVSLEWRRRGGGWVYTRACPPSPGPGSAPRRWVPRSSCGLLDSDATPLRQSLLISAWLPLLARSSLPLTASPYRDGSVSDVLRVFLWHRPIAPPLCPWGT